jgi:two-component system, chemotaxis family, protein-glutamate methylesterase/glutaminase
MSRFDVVAIGASLGGLDAVETLLEALPKTYPAALLIVQHRRADSDSRLLELLRCHSLLPVSEPEDKQPLEPGHVYLAPPNYHMLVERGLLSLSIDPPVAFARPSIDVLFESVADAYGPRAVGVVLTGSNHDGAAGAAAIKRRGGIVLVQDPSSAEAPETPRAALAATRVDAVLGLPALALRLNEITSDDRR